MDENGKLGIVEIFTVRLIAEVASGASFEVYVCTL